MKKMIHPEKLILMLILLLGVVGLPKAHSTPPEAQAVETKTTSAQSGGSLPSRRQILLKEDIIQTVVVFLIGYTLMFALIGFINQRIKDIKARHNIRKKTVYFVNFFIGMSVLFIWIHSFSSLTIFLGVAGAGLALSLQEAILCMAGWLLILVRHPFEVGDRIEINDIKGDVIDIRLFQTSMLEIGNWVDADQSTGRIVNFPNSYIFKSQNYNYSRGFEFIWHEIPFLLTFESDWKRGKEIILSHGQKVAEGMEEKMRHKINAMRNRYMIHYGKTGPIVYVNIKNSGVELTLRYLTEAKNRRATQDELCQAILNDCEQEPNVNFAYPTYRIVKE